MEGGIYEGKRELFPEMRAYKKAVIGRGASEYTENLHIVKLENKSKKDVFTACREGLDFKKFSAH